MAIIAAHAVLLAAGLYLVTNHLPLRADFSYLLPQDATSVIDLRKLEGRVNATETSLVLIQAPTPDERAAVVAKLAAGFREISPELVEQVSTDQNDLREFLEKHAHLLVPLSDLEVARDALDRHIKQAKLDANPLFIDLDDEDEEAEKSSAGDDEQLDELREKRRAAQVQLDRLTNISADGKIALIQVRTSFRGTDAGRGERLIAELGAVRDRVLAEHPAVQVGFTGSVVTAVAEHRAIATGMLLSSLITGALVALVLVLYFRSATLLVLSMLTLGIGAVMSFGIAALTVGHLNAATAFLGAIIAGNGVNFGIVLIARYLEERRRAEFDVALAHAIAGTLRPTAVASLGAAIAYGSLAATSFRGFADFAIIGAIGMLVVWTASYVLLPALLVKFGRSTRIYDGDSALGVLIARVFGFRRARLVVALALVVGISSTVVVVRYIAADPFEYDIKQLRSEGADADRARAWMRVSDENFGRGISGRTVIAADRAEQVPQIVEALRALNAGVPPAQQTIGDIWSLPAFVPADQERKLAVLAEIRAMIDTVVEVLDEDERAELLELRPPDELASIDLATLPASLRERFTEKSGAVGLLIEIRPSAQLDEWNGKDLIRFSNAVRELELASGETVTTSGTSVIFADMVQSIRDDGPFVTLTACVGLLVMVLLLVGPNRRAFAVLVATASGTLLMIALCALIGIKVNFLDFVALPITLGLGIDYAINVAHRQDQQDLPDPFHALRTSGSAVFLCSLTTVIGYGSLLVSDNLAIRGFGLASLIGELTCLVTAFVLVPALLSLGRERRMPSA